MFVALLLAALLPLTAAEQTPVAQAQSTSVPGFLRDLPSLTGQIEDATIWTVGGGYLYWTNCTGGGGGYLRRWPIGGGRAATLAASGTCPLMMSADDAGLYYHDNLAGAIMYRAASDPLVARVVATSRQPVGEIVLDANPASSGSAIYWLERTIDGTDTVIRSARRSNFEPLGIGPEPLGPNATSLIIAGSNMYYFANGTLNELLTLCLGIGGGTCVKTPKAAATGKYLNPATLSNTAQFTSESPLWANGSTLQSLHCNSSGTNCTVSNLYTAPTVAGLPYDLGKFASDGTFLFWIENQCDPQPDQMDGCSWKSTGRLMKRLLTVEPGDTRPFRSPQPIACQNCNGTYSIDDSGSQIGAGAGWIFFRTSNGLSRIRADAPAISWDLALLRMEVTQGVQGLANDVPLVAEKPTYVRVYGDKLSGPDARGVDAELVGTTSNGVILPGSPLRPVNGVRDFSSNNRGVQRGNVDESWIFRLPPEWTHAGSISLLPRINPNTFWNDPDGSNDTLPRASFTFINKAPICVVFVPVRANPRVQLFSDAHNRAIDMARRLLPSPDVWVYHQDEDVAELEARFGLPPWRYGPYELADDSWKVLASLQARDIFSDDPDRCDDARARTHYAGVAHADAGGANGTAFLGGSVLWFRVPSDSYFMRDWQADRAVTLAHELAHNYGRRHVDCGSPDDPGAFPYPPCQIDVDDGVERHYGFTYDRWRSNFTAIAPTSVGDLLSYSHSISPTKSRWISDFSWRGLLNEIPNGATTQAAEAAARVDLQAGSGVVLIAGAIDLRSPTNSILNHAWVLPNAAISQRTLRKWQRLAAPDLGRLGHTLQAGSHQLRLLDANGTTLADRAVILEDAADEGGPVPFQISFPAPPGQVARIELLDGTTLLTSRTVGAGAPTLSIVAPAGGETLDQQLTLIWRASDPDASDRLLFTVQYSPDNGQSWRAVLTDFPQTDTGNTISVPLASLSGWPGSTTGGRIRVLASDGYHTTIATSEPFTVPNRKPQPTILAPWAGQSVAAGSQIVLHGTASDAEDGSLSGDALRWAINDVAVGSGAELSIADLAPGLHTITLTARDTAGNEQSVTQSLTVEPLVVPLGAAPTLDGSCSDAGYSGAARVQLAPDANGIQAAVRLLRSENHLWICFTNLTRASSSAAPSLAVVRIDSRNASNDQPQADDYGFSVGEDGTPDTFRGNGSGGLDNNGPGGLDARASSSGNAWQAELRIDASVLGGWNRIIGLDLEHVFPPNDGVQYWPYSALWHKPSSWARTLLGTVAQVATLSPAAATAGASGVTITIDGTGFVEGSVVRWDGQDRPTTRLSETQLQATIRADDLVSARTAAVSVATPGGGVSRTLPFVVGPAPQRAEERGGYTTVLPIIRR